MYKYLNQKSKKSNKDILKCMCFISICFFKTEYHQKDFINDDTNNTHIVQIKAIY